MPKPLAVHIEPFLKRGVLIAAPALVSIDQTVAPEHIAPGTVIHPFCRISGSKTSIGPDCVLGAEAPVTIDNCQLGSQVQLAGGYFSGATFLDNSRMGSCAHVRPGTLVEEDASGAHAVGLKQTVLFPWVALGSLVNFCDCLMAGGTSRKNHSEVGSAYIHFNYTPHQDKATPSLIGDVPRGVLLDQPPIFLGGQGGLVGPARVTYGAITPAGIVIRKDILNPGLATVQPEQLPANLNQFTFGVYRSIDRIIRNNLIYIGNIYALRAWYRCVRAQFMTREKFSSACLAGALERLESISGERINRLDELAGKMSRSIELNERAGGSGSYLPQQEYFVASWPRMKEEISRLAQFEGEASIRDILLAEISERHGQQPYLTALASLSPKIKSCATSWLQSIVDRVAAIWKYNK